MKKSWQQKLHNGKELKIEVTEKDFADIPAGSKMLIATPEIVNDYVRQIPEGVHTSLQQMRKDLAAEYHADYTCPVTSGIFLRIAAEAAYEEYLAGKSAGDITAFWRMIDSKSPALKKLSCGKEFVLEQRKKEGLD
jgi:hypothetical protein